MGFDKIFEDGKLIIIGGVNVAILRVRLVSYLKALGVEALDYTEIFWQLDNNPKYKRAQEIEDLFTEINNQIYSRYVKEQKTTVVVIHTHRESEDKRILLRERDLDFARNLRSLAEGNIYYISKLPDIKPDGFIGFQLRRHDKDHPESFTLYWDSKSRRIISSLR